MQIRTIAALALCGVMLAGCASRPGGMQDALSYDAKSLTHVKMPDDTYRVFEHPSHTKLMVTPGLGTGFAQGFVQGATFGIANTATPEQRLEAAARKHLDDTGRANCKIVSGYELIKGQYEFNFDCPS